MKQESKPENTNEALKAEILAMVREDQEMRKSHEWDSEIDRRNTERVREIIKTHGWPGKVLLGEAAARGIWLLVQHADHDPDFQEQALGLLKTAVAKGEAEKKSEAYLTDRIRVNKGIPQIFGTQFFKDSTGKFGPRPIEDIEHLEERRKEFGLESFPEYEKKMEEKNRIFDEKEKGKPQE